MYHKDLPAHTKLVICFLSFGVEDPIAITLGTSRKGYAMSLQVLQHAPSIYPLRHPTHHPTKTMESLSEEHWGGAGFRPTVQAYTYVPIGVQVLQKKYLPKTMITISSLGTYSHSY